MLVLGHMGIGSGFARLANTALPSAWLLLGTLLPDIVDKPLYQACSWVTGQKGAAIGMISCTRTLGHSGLFLLMLTLVAVFAHSRCIATVAAGVATHLALDVLEDLLVGPPWPPSSLRALLFPLVGGSFASQMSSAEFGKLAPVRFPVVATGEVIGLLCLLWWRGLRNVSLSRLREVVPGPNRHQARHISR